MLPAWLLPNTAGRMRGFSGLTLEYVGCWATNRKGMREENIPKKDENYKTKEKKKKNRKLSYYNILK